MGILKINMTTSYRQEKVSTILYYCEEFTILDT